MAIVIKIKQKPIFKKVMDQDTLGDLCVNNNLVYGVPNSAYALDSYEGGKNITNKLFILFNEKQIGRGFSFIYNNSQVELILNMPSTKQDIIMFYRFVESVCKYLGTNKILIDNQKSYINKVEYMIDITIDLSAKSLKEFCLKENMKLFGAIYPISLEDDFRKEVLDSTNSGALIIFANYLHEKQNIDYYYAKALMLQDENKKQIHGTYVLTENVDSIFPITPYIPLNLNLDPNTLVDEWSVTVMVKEENDYKALGKIPFDEFAEIAHINKRKKFDQTHIFITVDKSLIKKLEKKFIEI